MRILGSNPNPSRITDESWGFMERVLTLSSQMENSGIYANKPGFHNTRAANSSGNYSVQGVRNQRGPSDKAAAYDISFKNAHNGDYSTIAAFSQRLYVAGQNSDPRMKGWYEFFGNTDWDSYVEGWCFAKHSSTTSDSSHLWHIHLSELREMLKCWINKDACWSTMAGESLGAWKTRLGFPAQYCGVNLLRDTWGAAVSLVQKRLGVSDDGEFGPNTENAVKSFQKSKGLPADGIVGPTTWTKLAEGQSGGGPNTQPGKRKTVYLALCKPVHGDAVFFGDGNFWRPVVSMAHADGLAAAGAVWKDFQTEYDMFQTIGPMPLSCLDDLLKVSNETNTAVGNIQVASGADPAAIAKAVCDEEGRRMSAAAKS